MSRWGITYSSTGPCFCYSPLLVCGPFLAREALQVRNLPLYQYVVPVRFNGRKRWTSLMGGRGKHRVV